MAAASTPFSHEEDMSPEEKNARQNLRRQLRTRRLALSQSQQAQAAAELSRQIFQLPQILRTKHIALYVAQDGEIDPNLIAQQLWKRGKYCYLPCLGPGKTKPLWFVEFTPTTQLIPNRFGIPEPNRKQDRRLPTHLLDVVLIPLVGFDRQGNRLGMGGGFYDATFAFKKNSATKPLLIGLAHACQEIDQLQIANWDIPLNAVATDKEVIWV
jgi:5-formyltetrahydrofolate cyclo-ligase